MKNREFWMQVFITYSRNGFSVETASKQADEAVNQLNIRQFPDEVNK